MNRANMWMSRITMMMISPNDRVNVMAFLRVYRHRPFGRRMAMQRWQKNP
jgi:hypothetical protein